MPVFFSHPRRGGRVADCSRPTADPARRWPAALALTGSLLLTAIAPSAAALSTYVQDFEGLAQADAGALAGDGWRVFGSVFESGGDLRFAFGVFDAPNGGDSWSAIDAGQGGPDQGAKQLSVYSIYSCCDLGSPVPSGHGNGTDIVEALVFQEQLVGDGDIGSTWQFSFDAKRGNLEGASVAYAFIQTLDPDAGFAVSSYAFIPTTGSGDVWSTFAMSLFIDDSLDGHVLQFGFANRASGFEGSGVFYDNVSFSRVPVPGGLMLLATGLASLLGLRGRAR